MDLSVARGEVHGFLGPNGAGKSTTIRVPLGWLGIEAGLAIAAALIARSVALLGFGLDSGIEALASIVVIWRFTGTRLSSATSERRAQQPFTTLKELSAQRGAPLSGRERSASPHSGHRPRPG